MSTQNVSCECDDPVPSRQPTPSHSQESRPHKSNIRRDHYSDRHFRSCDCEPAPRRNSPPHSRRESPSYSRRESPAGSRRESPAPSRTGSTTSRIDEYGEHDPHKPIISCLCENNPGKPKERKPCPEHACCKCPKNKKAKEKKQKPKEKQKGSKKSDIELICECNPDKKKKK